jgi:hypothetical protein
MDTDGLDDWYNPETKVDDHPYLLLILGCATLAVCFVLMLFLGALLWALSSI